MWAGDYIYLEDGASGTISRVSKNGGTRQYVSPGSVRNYSISPDTNTIVYIGSDNDGLGVFMAASDGSGARVRVSASSPEPISPVFGSNNTEVYYPLAGSVYNVGVSSINLPNPSTTDIYDDTVHPFQIHSGHGFSPNLNF